jgi:uncharacterized protein YkwD
MTTNYYSRLAAGLLLILSGPLAPDCAFGDTIFLTESESLRHAPPPPPPIQYRTNQSADLPSKSVRLSTVPAGLTLYSIGNPTDEEQLYLEFINRARMNPLAEGLRFQTTTDAEILDDYDFFGVDLKRMVAQFQAIPPVPPLSMNARLTAAARLHSQDMLANKFQEHSGSDGSTIGNRITAQGYDWSAFGENIFSFAKSVWHGHAAFEVDWGGNASTGGMQDPPGHRVSIHQAAYKEVGIGVIKGTNGKVGPQLVTQDFGNRRNLTPFITGVVYFDLNGNNFYDLGEGIAGITVTVAGSSSYAVTAASGGYSVPVPGNGAYSAKFSFPGLPDNQKSVAVANNENVKLDCVPTYTPPSISGPDQALLNQNNLYEFFPVAGAKSYQSKWNRRVPLAEVEGAENGSSKIVAMTTPGYEIIDSQVKASGSFSFHLAQPSQENQTLTLNRLFRPSLAAQLVFSSRLGFAGNAQVARAQISSDGGVSWAEVWSQTGTENRGETAFTRKTIPLGDFAGMEIMVRFKYDFMEGTYYQQTDPGVGLYIDDIGLTNTEELLEEVITDTASNSTFLFRPVQAGDYSLRVRAQVSERFLPWGPAKLVTAQAGAVPEPSVRITGIQNPSASQVQIYFEAANATGVAFIIESAPAITGPWTVDASASIQPVVTNSRFQATVLATGGQRFFRVRTRF